MEKELFQSYINRITDMKKNVPDWDKRPKSIIGDYLARDASYGFGRILVELFTPAYKITAKYVKRGQKNMDSEEVYDLASRLMSENRVEDYKFQAYLFAVSMAVSCFSETIIDDDIIANFDDDELIRFDGSANVIGETDACRINLTRYGRRLLDFSRNNQLVNFKQLKSSSMELYVADLRRFFKKMAEKNARIYFSGWDKLDHPKMVYKCGLCKRVEIFDYDFSVKKEQLAKACPQCDDGNTHNRKSMKPIKEKLTFLGGEKYVCSCGNKITIEKLLKNNLICPQCNKPVKIDSAPIVFRHDLEAYGEDEVVCSLNSSASGETLQRIMGKAKNLERNFGLHVLYIACGFLNWKDQNGTKYRSPILLCPVTLSVDTAKGKYYLEADRTAEGMFEVNKTLIQMLASYSSTCSIQLPELERDVYSYFALVKSRFENASGIIKNIVSDWSIDSGLGIGLFHYQKLQLHYDMEMYADKYLEHPVIRRLCGDDEVKVEKKEKTEHLPMTYMLLDADSSQEEVIKCAQEGQSFILQGPPGSGKSQTITNIIANALGEGKSVLFVTEKAAARSVIIDNLQRCHVVGDRSLTEFVIDFDTFKKRGGAVGRDPFIRELNQHLTAYRSTGGYDDKLFIDERNTYDKIAEFMAEAHGEYDGKNYLRLLNDMAPYADADELRLSAEYIPTDREEFAKLYDSIESYYAAAVYCPGGVDYNGGVLSGCRGDTGNTLYRAAVAYQNVCSDIEESIGKLRSLGLQIKAGKNCLKESVVLLRLWSGMPALTRQILENIGSEKLSGLIKRAEERRDLATKVMQHEGSGYKEILHHDKAMAFDAADATEKAKKYSLFIHRIGKNYRAWSKSIFDCFKSVPAKAKYTDTIDALKKLLQYKDYNEQLEVNLKLSGEDLAIFGYEPKSADEWEQLINCLNTAMAVITDTNTAILDINKNSAWAIGFESATHDEMCGKLVSLAEALEKALAEEEEKRKIISGYFDTGEFTGYYPPCKAVSREIIDNKQYLAPLCRRAAALEKIKENDWLPVLEELIEEKSRDFGWAAKRLYKTYYENVISIFIEDNNLETLRDFTRSAHENLLQKYRDAEMQLFSSGARRLYETLKSKLKAAANSVQGEISEEFPKLQSRARYSIKRTILENWEYIKRIKPCFMMSPLNVSQYIDIGVAFDLVIFDEASQIFTEDALASIVRGKQIIIAGDSKQLPPCDFFRAGDSSLDDEDSYYEEDSNSEYSLLTSADEALPETSVSLMWHYRSNDESLIHFANKEMEYNLITFPSAIHNPDDGVRYVRIPYKKDGCYGAGKGGSHTNPAEADEIVKLIYNEMCHPRRSTFSIGVVAFSNAQAFEIEARWEKYKQDPSRRPIIDKWEREHEYEPLIFCNLDTVQGDERDTTIISVCYSQDANGKFILPYLGRIRLESGKKRINVAVTRARHRMIVVAMLEESTLSSAINLSSASDENKAGAKMLLHFLEYARKCGDNERHNEVGEKENSIAKSICDVLDKNNIAYDCEVGMSECKINIAIRDRHVEGDYCLGIIIDDPGRVDFDSVREYSRLTQQVLTGKYGWRIYRIYPAAWIKDYNNEKTMLLENVRRAMTV